MSSDVNEELRFSGMEERRFRCKSEEKHCIPEFKNIYIFLSSIYWKGLGNEQCG